MRKIFASNWSTIFVVLIIAILSLFTILGIKPVNFQSQLAYFLIGFVIYYLVSKIHPSYFQYFSKFFYLGSVAVLIVTLLVGIFIRGSVRWVDIGIVRFQPSEIVKPFLIIFFANQLSNFKNTAKFFIKQIAFFAILAGLVFRQPDFGNSIIYFLIFVTMVFFSKIKLQYLFIFLAFMMVSVLIAMLFLRPYQRDRFASFLNPSLDPQGTAYHQIQSVITVGSGKLIGRGLARGTQTRLLFLPEKETDFIFASYAEQLGFSGTFFLLVCYFFIFFKLIFLVSKTRQEFDRMLLIGVLAYLFFQTTIHVGMNIGILPVTGITLPLFSAGGSSITSVLFALGLVAFYEKNLI